MGGQQHPSPPDPTRRGHRPPGAPRSRLSSGSPSPLPTPPPPAPPPPQRGGIPWPALVVLVLILVALGIWRWHETAKTPLPRAAATAASGPSQAAGENADRAGGDRPAMRQVASFDAGGEVVALAISPDGYWVAWGLDARGAGIALRDAAAKERIISFRPVGFTAQTTSAVFLDNRTLLATMGQGVYVCSLRTRVASPLKFYDGEQQGQPLCVAGVRTSGSRVRLAVGLSTGAIEMLDTLVTEGIGLLEGQPAQFDAHKGPVRSILFANSGRLVASASEDATLRIMQAADGKYVSSQPIAIDGRGVDFARGMDLLSYATGDAWLAASGRSQVVLWDARSWTPAQRLDTGGSTVLRVAFSRDGLLAAVSADLLVIWDMDSGREIARVNRPQGGKAVGGLAFFPDGQALLSGGADGSVRRWSIGRP